LKFTNLNLSDSLLDSIDAMGFEEMTAIQEQAIPVILEGHDLIASAQTGTGKTAAFAIPILQLLSLDKKEKTNSKKIKALIVTPTRELAIQIGESFTVYGKYTGIKNTVIFGGVKQLSQTNTLRNGVDVLIATPGRLLDLINQKFIKLTDIKYFVLDEADRMLDMGFIHDIKKIITLLPSQRQSLFFSATMPQNIVALSQKILKNPIKVEVSPVSSTAQTIQQYLYYTNRADKPNLLYHLLKNKEIDKVLVFSRTKHGADRIARNLNKKNIKAAAIHGDKAQNQRQKALSNFKNNALRVLVATDIAARGIDIDKLKYIINYDIKDLYNKYVHRIGRSGRAGEEGIAISICEPEENIFIKDIEKLIRKEITVAKENPYPQTDNPMNDKEKKEWEKEKQRKKQEFFAARKNKKEGNQKSKKYRR